MELVRILSLLALSLSIAPSMSLAEDHVPWVQAVPSYSDFGSVKAPSSRTTVIQYINHSNESVLGFNAWCSGDLSVFSCMSFCVYIIPPFGSCTVQVTFSPRSGDDLTKSVTVFGMGGGAMSTAQVTGRDAK